MTDLDAYRALYVAESRENHENIVANLLELERGEDNETAINEIFRAAHSLKGMSASMGFDDMEAVCHTLEDVFSQIRNGTLEVTHGLMDTLLAGVDDIEMMVDDIEDGGSGVLSNKEARVTALKAWISTDPAPDILESPQQQSTTPEPPLQSEPEVISSPDIPLSSSFEEEGTMPSYTISITLAPNVDSKNLRGMLLLQNLDSFGAIFSTSPDRETIEDDPAFSGSFEVTIASDAGRAAIEAALSTQDVGTYSFNQDTSAERSGEKPLSLSEKIPTNLSPAEGDRYTFEITIANTVDSKNLRSMVFLQNFEALGTIASTTPDRETIEDDPTFSGIFTVVIDLTSELSAFESILNSSDIEHYKVIKEEGGERKEIVFRGKGEKILLNDDFPTIKSVSHDEIKSIDVPQDETERSVEVPTEISTPSSFSASTPSTPRPVSAHQEKAREVKNIRVGIDRLDQMMNLVEDLVINRGRLEQIAQQHKIKELDETLNMVGRSVAELQDMMMGIRMIPLNQTFNRFPRTVRDIALREKKEVDFIIKGGETELDRSVMEGLNDPLLHLIRNGIDHGIESPDVRVANGKSPKGTLTLAAFRDKGNVIIVIEDDGVGMDPNKIRKKALEKRLIPPDVLNEMSDEEIFNLVFYPGFSTADEITDISGRGVGLDVVKTTIAELQGSINLTSELGKGSKFELILPPTMAIVMVMMVQINARRCAIPITHVAEVASLSVFPIQNIGHGEGILMRDEIILLYRLYDMFGDSEHEEIVVVIQNQNKKGAIAVDLIEGQQEVVIKPLSKYVGSCSGISGVTIPGDGEVVPVLDVNEILSEYKR
jgi:two-component system chemotaxis sensor kinase CheA